MSESEQPTPSNSSTSAKPAESIELTFPDEAVVPKDLILWAGVLLLLTLIAYWPSTDGKFLWRDNRTVSDNILLAKPGGLVTAWTGRWQTPAAYPLPQYHPAAFTTNWLVYRLFGHDEKNLPTPFAYHVTSLLLHAGAAILLWFILRKLKVPGAWLAAGVFALHPINTEAVAWISQLDTVQAGLLFLGAIHTYLLFAEEDLKVPGMIDPGRQWGFYAASLVLFALAMLSKSTAFAMPFVMLLILWWQRRLTLRHLGLLLPFIIVAVALGFAAADFERDFAGANIPVLSFAQRLIIAGSSLWFYTGKLLIPHRLTFLYPAWVIDPQNLLQFVPVAAIGVIIVGLLLAQKRIGRGVAVAILAFIGCLFPLLGFYNIVPMRHTFVADHYAYLAGAPFIALVIAAGTKAVRRVALPKSHGATAVGLSAILLVVLGSAAWTRAHAFKDSLTLWQNTVDKNPNSWFVQDNVAAAWRIQANADLLQGDEASLALSIQELDEALKHAQQAAMLNPEDAQAELTWGGVLGEQRHIAEAIPHFERATQLDPTLAEASHNLAEAWIRLKQYPKAIQVLDQAMVNQPPSSTAHRLLAAAFANMGGKENEARAMSEDRVAIQLQNDNVLAREHLANLLANAGQDKEAIEQLTMVAMLQQQEHNNKPEVWNALGKLEARKGEMALAIKFFTQALTLDPTYVDAKRNLDLAESTLEKSRRMAATRTTTAPSATQPGSLPQRR